jgi:hypothetical protein
LKKRKRGNKPIGSKDDTHPVKWIRRLGSMDTIERNLTTD